MALFNLRYYQHALSLLAFLLAAFVQAQQVTGTRISAVSKSDNDNRDYRYLTLTNNLRVLLISDSSAEKSAAALNIHIGSHQNPKDRPGLAHFLEHMLFLGTEKYPKPGEYQDFISQHGGTNNAYTADENTSYFFDIEHSSLEPALDRFAQFFITPLFDTNYIDHEKNAVNAEYLAKINDDDRREWDAYRNLFNPDHPAANFTVGSLESLADREEHSIRDDLMAFYQNNYSANLMTLAVLSNRKLDDLQKIVETRFAAIPNKNKVIARDYPSLFLPNILPASLSVKPLKELRQISLIFPVPRYADRYKTKPLDYLGHLIGNEGAGSLLAMLKNLGWAESLSAGEIYASRHDSLFGISIKLTKEGVKAKDQIVSAVFDYIKITSLRGIAEWRFIEMQQIADLNYRFHDKLAAIDSVSELSQAMQDYSAVDVLWGKYAYTQYDDGLIKQALSYLRPDNVFISTVEPDVITTRLSTFYKTEYGVKPGIPDILDLKPIYHQRLWLPDRNIFIPKNLVVKTSSMLPVQEMFSAKNIPILLTNNDQFRLWFLQDKKFRSPKAELNFRFKLPVLNNSLDNTARAQLFAAMITDQLNEYAYPASIAGLTFSVSANARGFDVNVAGYTDKQSLFINKILNAIVQADFSQARFDKLKDDLILEWRNEDKNLPYSVLAKKVARLQYMPYWGVREFIDPLQKTSFEQFKQFSLDILRGAKLEALFYGNLYPQDAIKLSAIIEHQLLKKHSNRLPQMAKVLRADNKDNKSWLYVYPLDHNDRAVELYIQALSPNIDDMAHMRLLTQILEPEFFNQLRTEKQLGYVVAASSLPIRNVEGCFFVVQSPNATANVIADEINSFLNNVAAKLVENFAANKAALLAELQESPLSLAEQSEIYWESIVLNDYEFARRQELIAALTKITPETLRKYYETAFLQKNRRLWLSTEKFDNLKDFETIQNVAEYQQKQSGYLQP